MAAVELATAYVTLVSSAQDMGTQITNQLQAAGDPAGQQAGSSAGGKFSAAFGVAIAGIAAVGGIAKGLFDVGAVFDDVSDTIRVGTGATGEALDALVGSAERVGTTVPVSFEKASEVVSGLSQRLGLTGATLDTVASQYAAAGNILGEDVDIAATSAAFTAFGIEGDAVTGAMDRLYQVSQATGVGFNELASSVQAQAPAVQALGFSFDETTAIIGNLDKAGLNSSAVIASMGKGLVKLAKDGEEPQEAFQRVTGEIGSLVAAGDKAAALDLAAGIFGTKGAVQFVAAVESGTIATGDLGAVAGLTSDTILGAAADTADFAESLTLFKNNALLALKPAGDAVFGGISAAMAKAVPYATTLGEGISRLFEIGSATFQYLGGADITVFDGLLDDFGGFADAMTVVRDTAQNIFAAVGPIFTAVGGAVRDVFASVGPALMDTFSQIGTTLGGVFAQLGPIFGQLAPVFGQLLPLLNPVGVLLKAFLPVLPPLAEAFGDIAVTVAGAVTTALQSLAPLLPIIADALGRVATVVGEGLITLIEAAAPVVVHLGEAFTDMLPSIIELVESVLPPLEEIFTNIVPVLVTLATAFLDILIPAIDAVLPVVQTAFDAIGPVIQAALDIVIGIIDVVTGILTGDWGLFWDGILSVVTGVWDLITGVIDGAVAIVSGVLQAAWDIITAAASTAWNLVKDFIMKPLQTAWDWISGVFQGVIGTIAGVWNNIVSGVTTILGNVWQAIEAPFQTAWDWITGVFTLISGAIAGIWRTIVGGVGDILSGVFDAFIQPFQDAWDWVTDIFSGIVDTVRDIWNNVLSVVGAGQAQLDAAGNGYVATGGSDALAADGAVVPPRPGGTRFIVGEAGEQELITPTGLMRSVFADVLNNTQLAGAAVTAGPGRVLHVDQINTADPDVMPALERALFAMV